MKEFLGGRRASTATEYALIVGILVLAIAIGMTEIGLLVRESYGSGIVAR